jgi:hypothetical protein
MNIQLMENKNLYKIFLSIVKYTPMIVAITHVVALLLHYLGISAILLSCFSGISILFVILLYIMSYVFKFCYLYRIPLWYITTVVIINTFKIIDLLSIQNLLLYRLYAIIFGIFLVIFVIYMYKNRNNPKVDYIKQLCDTYCGC